METETPRPARGLLLRLFWTGLLAVLIAYPLSIGPFSYYLVLRTSPYGEEYLYATYFPLLWLAGKWPPLQSPLDAYVGFWTKLAFQHREARHPAAPATPSPVPPP